MKIKTFITNLKEDINTLNYNLWFGNKNQYVVEKNVENNVLILEQFRISPFNKRQCEYDVNFNFYLMKRQPLEFKTINKELEWLDILYSDSSNIINLLYKLKYMQPLIKKENVELIIYGGETNQSTNQQAIVRWNLPLRIFLL